MATVAIVRDDVGLNEMLYDFTYKRVAYHTQSVHELWYVIILYAWELYGLNQNVIRVYLTIFQDGRFVSFLRRGRTFLLLVKPNQKEKKIDNRFLRENNIRIIFKWKNTIFYYRVRNIELYKNRYYIFSLWFIMIFIIKKRVWLRGKNEWFL